MPAVWTSGANEVPAVKAWAIGIARSAMSEAVFRPLTNFVPNDRIAWPAFWPNWLTLKLLSFVPNRLNAFMVFLCVCTTRNTENKKMDPRFQLPPSHTGLVPSGKYAPVRMFLNSYCADYERTTGDMIFNLRQDISVDQGTDIYMSLREMTVANSEYNITDKNNSIYIVYG